MPAERDPLPCREDDDRLDDGQDDFSLRVDVEAVPLLVDVLHIEPSKHTTPQALAYLGLYC